MPLSTADVLSPVGLGWRPNGQVVLSGPLLRLADACDRAFVALASSFGAEEERHPPFIAADDLRRVDYFESFPHLVTFPVSLRDDDGNLAGFRDRPVDGDGGVQLTATAPVLDVLTPAACYHLYVHHEGESFAGPHYITTRNTCFRREAGYVPLQRQSAFQMREVVCFGTTAEVGSFLDRARALVDALTATLELDVAWVAATDPFFRPSTNPKYLLQRVQPVKQELVFDGHLALASLNNHHDFFGSTFGLRRDGAAASSGCLAFGIERWLYALTVRHGNDPAGWPDMAEAAEAAER